MIWQRYDCDGLECTCPACGHQAVRRTISGVLLHTCAGTPGGAGTELKSLLGWFGMKPTPGCKCERRARLMDTKGCDWCEQNLAEIVGWLQEEHGRQGISLPFVALAAEQLVKLAIRRARKKGICR